VKYYFGVISNRRQFYTYHTGIAILSFNRPTKLCLKPTSLLMGLTRISGFFPSFPRSSVGMPAVQLLVPTLRRGNAY
jgi:hypothetical protein